MQQSDERKKKNAFLKEVHKRYNELNTDSFSITTRTNLLTRYLTRGKECRFFLNKESFETLFLVLNDIILPENKVTLIVTKDVLKNEEKSPIEQLPYMVDPEQQNQTKPRISNLLTQENIYISELINIPPFIVVDHRSYLIGSKDDKTNEPFFICALNAPFDCEQAKRLDLLYRTFSEIKMDSTPFKELSAQKITQQTIPLPFNQNVNTKI